MDAVSSSSGPDALMRARFEAALPVRLQRAARVRLQHFIPAHWFSAAASDCANMYISGYFYGAISVAQAYVEALSKFLAEHHQVPVRNDVAERCRRLNRSGVISKDSLAAALAVLEHRNDFHHLNETVPAEYAALEARAEGCINSLQAIESEVFSYSISSPGQIVLAKPEYWPDAGSGLTSVQLRNLL